MMGREAEEMVTQGVRRRQASLDEALGQLGGRSGSHRRLWGKIGCL